MKISIVIPMFNAENYIGDCLDSILNQTFKDFEVIAVDDCSTDNSCAVVKSYLEKFGGRLKILNTEKNSGGGGYVSRNIGLKVSCGEYIFFVDADDFIVETALEILYTAAKSSDADVVYTAYYYFHDKNNKIRLVADKEAMICKKSGAEDAMTLTIENPEEIAEKLFTYKGLYHMPWTKFVKRKFLVENKIEFPQIISGGDFIWTIQIVYCAKRFLRLPLALYFYNDNPNSLTQKKKNPNKKIVESVNAFISGAKALENLANKIDLFRQNKNYIYFAMEIFFYNCLDRSSDARKNFSAVKLCNLLYDNLKSKSHAESIIPFLFGVIDSYEKTLLKSQERIAELKNELNRKGG